MKYPAISKQPRRSVSVPELSGGVNLRDSISMISDNQLTECKNMWYRGGILKTRPACKAFSEYKIGRATSDEEVSRFKVYSHIKKRVGSEDIMVLHSCQKTYTTLDEEGNEIYCANIFFWWQGTEDGKTEDGGYISERGFNERLSLNYLVAEKDGTLYCYISNYCVYTNKYAENYTWRKIEDDEYHIPLVMSGCKMRSWWWYDGTVQDGTMIDGYNLLGNYYKMQFTSVNRELLSSGNVTTHPASFGLLHKIGSEMEGKSVKLSYLSKDGKTYKHEVLIDSKSANGGWYIESTKQSDGYYMMVNGWTVRLSTVNSAPDGNAMHQNAVTWQISDYVCENNVEITAPCQNSSSNLDKIFKMTQAEWFGGSAKGINGGSYLFLTGNAADNEGALVVWSGLNEPLYFSENNYFYVGNKAHRVTCFGKQADKLIIFKENETYYTYYKQNDEISADDLINQSVVDYSASSVYFPMVLINSVIGCDCPNTVQLCRNRLVWMSSNGRVYTLTSESQYTERNIFEVSEMIESRLKAEGNKLNKAYSVDFEGYYMLFIENRVYAMSYNSYGYQYVYSFTKEEDANLKIPWYMWDFSLFSDGIGLNSYRFPVPSVINNKLVLSSLYNAESSEKVSMMGFVINPEKVDTFDRAYSESGDKEFSIESSLQTKIFDFGAPNYRKNIDLVQLSLGNNEGVPIEVQFVTDSGTEEECIILSEGETEPDNPEYLSSVSLNPCIRSVIRFGIKLSCKGILAVDSMSLHYRLLGGAR